MAGRGPTPKPADQRRRRNAAPGTTQLVADGKLHGPDLPELPNDEWHPRTRAWWSTWRHSAQAQGFTATDWDFLLDTALMHHVMWSKGRWEFAAELRLRAAKFGATPEDRARLRIEILPAGESESAKPSGPSRQTRQRRERLLRAVEDAG